MHSKKVLIVAVVCTAVVSVGGMSGLARDSEPGGSLTPAVARVGEVRLSEEEFTVALELARASEALPYVTEDELRTLATRLLRTRILAERARVLGIDQEPKVRLRFEAILRDELIRREVDAKMRLADVTEAQIQAYFETHAHTFVLRGMLSVHHIFLSTGGDSGRTRKETDSVADRIGKAATEASPSLARFQALVVEHSDDDATKSTMGLLGTYVGQDLEAAKLDPHIGPVVQAVLALKNVGDITDPIETPRGLHIARLSGRRAERHRPLTEVREVIRRRLYADARQEKLSRLLDDAGLTGMPVVNTAVISQFLPKRRAEPSGDGPPSPPTVPFPSGRQVQEANEESPRQLPP